MENHILFFIALSLLSLKCAALDTIYANQEIKDGKDTLVSQGEMFELGFFSPGKSKNRYLGIWYKKISNGTVVWVANRETPITDTSGMLKLSRQGDLVILSGGNTTVWPSNTTVSARSNNHVVAAQLLDNGNLVVRNENNIIWQSFDYPGDTHLPGMKLGKDLVTGLDRFLTSWKSPDDPSIGMKFGKDLVTGLQRFFISWKSLDDPSPGEYSIIHDTNGYPQMLVWQGDVVVARLGPWNGLGFSGFPIEIENQIYSTEFVMNENEKNTFSGAFNFISCSPSLCVSVCM